MSDYIKREDAIKIINSGISVDTDADKRYVNGLFRAIRPADVAPVRHGRWMKTDAYPHRVYCSVCSGTYAQAHWEVWKDGSLARAYCPNCGARMDGENDEIIRHG